MGYETPDFEVRNDPRRLKESAKERASILPSGTLVVVDQLTAWGLQGFTFHMQAGTESAGINSTVAIADTLVFMVADQGDADLVMTPLLYELNFELSDTGVFGEIMLEVDKEKQRWADDASGDDFVPESMNGRDINSFNRRARILSGAGVVLAAKTAVPDSIELARKNINEDVITDPTTGKMAWDPVIYSASKRPLVHTVGQSSIIGHFGVTTADFVGFGVLQFAQVPGGLIPSNS